ncbi:uncharacterized protein At2g39795, mitochondrial-like [Phalaenopsis equestris]|uniref:uncharacterized protein At2g39795, mitochondrial-like n=1 Tax=Phalaenopsis equestris TaxID=78828 RepID=UPI0009E2AF93|nr:uncharacterized protein At2g39795, mitochondrial-like [Phalaenopsis equestris]
MASVVARSILRRTSRFQISSTLSACFSSQASSSQSNSLVRRAQAQRLWYPPSFISLRFATFKVEDDDNLLKVLQSEIDCVQEPKNSLDIDVPKEFPFEIIDRRGDQTMTLKREYGDENIQLTVYMNLDQEGTTIIRRISLHITIDKGQGFILEFGCKLTSDELEIESMASSSSDHFDTQEAYQGPEFSDLDENLQKALHKYLEVRGINSSLYRFLYEYMINKDEREYLKWLKKLKEFIVK